MASKQMITPEVKAEVLKQYYDTDVEVKALAAKHGISATWQLGNCSTWQLHHVSISVYELTS